MNIDFFQQVFTRWLTVFAVDPMVQLMQIFMVLFGLIMVCIVFFTTRDVLLRSNSFLFMLFSILLVTIFPVGGLLIYLLIRPSRTVSQKNSDVILLLLKKKIDSLEESVQSVQKTLARPTTKVRTSKRTVAKK